MGYYLLTINKSPSQLTINLKEVYKDVVGAKIMRKDMTKLWSTEDFLGRDMRELLVWHYMMNHCTFKSFLILSKMVMIPRKDREFRKISPCIAFLFGKTYKRPCRTQDFFIPQ